MAVWYVRDNAPTSTIGWSAVAAWSTGTKTAGNIIRQLTTPAVGSERAFVCIVGGAAGGSEPVTWTITKGGKTTDNFVTWQECTGQPAVNGDLTNTPLSSSVRSTAPGLGKIIKDNTSAHIFIQTSASGTCAAGEPSYSTGALGNTTTDGTVTWTYIGTSFSAWAAPFARLGGSLGFSAAGDSLFCGDDHTETQSSGLTLTIPGTLAAPNFVYSVDHTVVPPTGTNAGASVATTGNTAIVFTGGSAEFDGLTFSAGSGANPGGITFGANGTWTRFVGCALKKLGTSANTSAIVINGVARVELVNTTLQFGATGDSIARGAGTLEWRNTASAIAGATLPTTLITPLNSTSLGETVLEGVDLSALGSGKTLVGAAAASVGTVYFIDCELGSGVTVAAPSNPGFLVDVIRSDSGSTNYNHQRYKYQGTLTTETTIIRTGGASDGTTVLSWKIVTTANSKWISPIECFPISIWNTVTGANVTVSLYGIWGGGAVPNTDDIWLDVDYLGTSGAPLASVVTGTKANNLASGSPWASDGSTWGGSTTAFKMSVTLTSPTPQLAGYVRIYVRAAKASTTFYIDPSPILS